MLVQREIRKSNFLVYRREGLPYKAALSKVISINEMLYVKAISIENTSQHKKILLISNSKIINHQPWVIKNPSTLIILIFLFFVHHSCMAKVLMGCFQSATTKKQPHPKQLPQNFHWFCCIYQNDKTLEAHVFYTNLSKIKNNYYLKA